MIQSDWILFCHVSTYQNKKIPCESPFWSFNLTDWRVSLTKSGLNRRKKHALQSFLSSRHANQTSQHIKPARLSGINFVAKFSSCSHSHKRHSMAPLKNQNITFFLLFMYVVQSNFFSNKIKINLFKKKIIHIRVNKALLLRHMGTITRARVWLSMACFKRINSVVLLFGQLVSLITAFFYYVHFTLTLEF